VALCAAGVGTLVIKAGHGEQTVQALRVGRPVFDASLDDAYYRCIDVQAHSLVSPGRPVLIEGPDFGAYVTLLKAVGSWVTFASHPSPSAVALSLNEATGRGTCHGSIVVAKETRPDGRTTTVVGSGASVAGTGPVPAPPLVRRR